MEVSALMLSNQLIDVGIYLHVVLHQLGAEVILVHGSFGIVLNGCSHSLLEGILRLSRVASLLVFLSSVEIEIVGVHGWVVGRILALIGVELEGLVIKNYTLAISLLQQPWSSRTL